jgi:hypothetical protein
MSAVRSLSGAKRTCRKYRGIDANDPSRHFSRIICCGAQGRSLVRPQLAGQGYLSVHPITGESANVHLNERRLFRGDRIAQNFTQYVGSADSAAIDAVSSRERDKINRWQFCSDGVR